MVDVRPEKVYGSSLLRVAELFEAVPDSLRIGDLARLFRDSERTVLALIDAVGRPTGIVTRNHLLSLLGKPFGQEILSKRAASTIAEPVEHFHQSENLFHVAEQLQATLSDNKVQFYLLIDDQHLFRGLFSSADLLGWLSRMTQEDIILASQLHERLVKARSGQSGQGWFTQGLSQSAKGLGGDFYHVIPLGANRVFLALGDVSGKGVAASVLTSLLWGVLQFYDYRKGLKKLLLQINEALIHTFQLEKYLTGIFALYDASQRELILADMGHGHSFLVRAGRVRPLRFRNRNFPLGIELSLKPNLHKMRLKPGDLLCLYTDGVTEQVNKDGQEFGERSLWNAAKETGTNPQRLPDRILEELKAHQGSVPRLDDLTWLQLLVE